MECPESRRGIINGAETATSVPCDPRKNRRTIRPAANIHTESRRSKCAEPKYPASQNTVDPKFRTPKQRSPKIRTPRPENGLHPKYRTPKQRSSKIRTPRERTSQNKHITPRLSPRIYTPALGARASAGARAGPQHPGCVSGVQQRIPTLNLILNLNPKLDLIPKLITFATPPDTHPRYRDPSPPPPHTHAPPPTQTPTPVCRSVVLLAAKKQRP